jgi:hypothetical protein
LPSSLLPSLPFLTSCIPFSITARFSLASARTTSSASNMSLSYFGRDNVSIKCAVTKSNNPSLPPSLTPSLPPFPRSILPDAVRHPPPPPKPPLFSRAPRPLLSPSLFPVWLVMVVQEKNECFCLPNHPPSVVCGYCSTLPFLKLPPALLPPPPPPFLPYLALSLLLFQHKDLLVLLLEGASAEEESVLDRVLLRGGKGGKEGGDVRMMRKTRSARGRF